MIDSITMMMIERKRQTDPQMNRQGGSGNYTQQHQDGDDDMDTGNNYMSGNKHSGSDEEENEDLYD